MSHRNCIALDKAGPDWPHLIVPILADLERFLRVSIARMHEREHREQERREQRQRREQLRAEQRRPAEERRQARLQRNQQIAELQAEGWGHRRIACALGLNPHTTRDVCRRLRRGASQA
jgi:DNA-binding NarL/FixJ family response regulator